MTADGSNLCLSQLLRGFQSPIYGQKQYVHTV